ncbi:MAG: L-2-hydroxyglutarate oxidase [Oceanicoccus sp.]
MAFTDPLRSYDYVIVGGGIVGISTAYQLKQRQPSSSVLIIEKEAHLAGHQTGHNSGVIHAGVYYEPGSLKADFCKRGALATMEFCRKYNIQYRQPGKLLIATNPLELQRMAGLKQRCKDNGITAQSLQAGQLSELEPNIVGLGALHIDQSGIVDYPQMTKVMAEQFQLNGGNLLLRTELLNAIERPDAIELSTSQGTIHAQQLICCAGLMADRITQMLDIKIDFAIVPFRGEYYQLHHRHQNIVKHLIYPIPDPDLPFLGVHLTPMIDGTITAGPNAVLGWKREGYNSVNFSAKDSFELLTFPGFWHLGRRHLASGLREYKNSLYKPGYLKLLRKYCPRLTIDDLTPYPAGVRAQAVMNDGRLVHDFLFAESKRSLHVCNAPSPAATSAIPIGQYIGDMMAKKSAAALD